MTCGLPRRVYSRTCLKFTLRWGRPIHVGDLKEAFNVIEKRGSSRSHGWRKTDKIEYALRKLFRKGKLSRSEKQVKLENYPASPYASVKSKTVNVYFYAPADWAGKTMSFQVYGNAVSVRFISCWKSQGEDEEGDDS